MKIYITHCTGIKDDSLINTRRAVLQEELYCSKIIQRFIARCKRQQVKYAIFSDKHGIWWPREKQVWYDKHPDSVTEQELAQLIGNFDKNLADFSEIWFYNNPSWFHPLYQQLIDRSDLHARITKFTHLKDIH